MMAKTIQFISLAAAICGVTPNAWAEGKLPDPFQFAGSDRRVKTKDDWKQRQAEMMKMLQHYVYGPAFPQVNKYKVESRTTKPLAGGNVIKYTASLKLGPDHSHPVTIAYYLLKNKESQSILISVVAREEPKDEDAIEITKRGYAYTALRVSRYERIARAIFPNVKGTRTMAWVWGMNEIINYLTHEHQFNKVILTGCSRYGRVALLTGALNQRVDLTAPITTLAHAVHYFDESMWGPGNVKWANKEYGTFAGKMNRLPVDRHFLGAVIAPRAYLGIMGAEKPAFNQGHIEAYEALVPVYEWLGARKKLGLYDHSPRGHGVEIDDLHTVLDFSDLIFFDKKPASRKKFDQISNPALNGFEWKAPEPISNGKTRQPGVEKAKKDTVKRTWIPERVLQGLDAHLDLTYARYGKRTMELDLYKPKNAGGPLPAIVCIHGGGWAKGNRKGHGNLAMALAGRGFVTVTISYRLSGEAPFPAAIHDCKAAVRWLRANAAKYNIDPKRIGAIGLSAGGHLTALLATSADVKALEGDGGNAKFSSAIQAAVPMGAQTDLESQRTRDISRDEKRGVIWRQFLGGSQEQRMETYRLASPLHHLDKSDPPTAFVTGEKDDPSTHASDFRAAATKLSIPTAIKIINEAPHPFLGRQDWFDQCVDYAAAFFTKHLKASR